MSLAALALATRDTLRAGLTEFYDNTNSTTQARNRTANCRVMPDERPAPNCGQEFISVFGASHSPRDVDQVVAIEEEFSLAVAVTRKIAVVPFDHRGEAGYVDDERQFILGWKSLEERCREITGLIDKNYQLLRDADALFSNAYGFQEPLRWAGTDPAPERVGAEHFMSFGQPDSDTDNIYGLLMRVRFGGAVRWQPNTIYDRYA